MVEKVVLVKALMDNAIDDIYRRWVAGEHFSHHPDPKVRRVEDALFRMVDEWEMTDAPDTP